MSRNDRLSCPQARERIEASLEGTLPASEGQRLEGHLAECSACVTYLARTRRAIALTREAVLPAVPDGAPNPAETEALLGMFRARGHHGAPVRLADVPLGIARQRAAEGDHIAYLAASEAELDASAGF